MKAIGDLRDVKSRFDSINSFIFYCIEYRYITFIPNTIPIQNRHEMSSAVQTFPCTRQRASRLARGNPLSAHPQPFLPARNSRSSFYPLNSLPVPPTTLSRVHHTWFIPTFRTQTPHQALHVLFRSTLRWRKHGAHNGISRRSDTLGFTIYQHLFLRHQTRTPRPSQLPTSRTRTSQTLTSRRTSHPLEILFR